MTNKSNNYSAPEINMDLIASIGALCETSVTGGTTIEDVTEDTFTW